MMKPRPALDARARRAWRWRLRVTASILLLGASPMLACADPAPQDDAAPTSTRVGGADPDDPRDGARLEVALVDGVSGAAVFQQGEPIELVLGFSSDRPGVHVIDAATYDRSGRLDLDVFALAPADGVVDPLAIHFEGGGGFVGGGLRATPTLGAEPYELRRTLNEHARFDRPGRYALRVTSRRLESPTPGQAPLVLTARDPLRFEVVAAEPAWAQAQVAAASATLDDLTASQEARREAARRLRFLADHAAVEAMVARLVGASEVQLELMFGLLGARDREHVIATMTRHLSRPEAAIDRLFLATLARLEAARDHPLPGRYPGQGDPREATWRAQQRALGEAVERAMVGHAAALLVGLERRAPAARAVIVQTLAELTWGWQRQPEGPDLSAFVALDARLVEDFSLLAAEQRRLLLEHRWARIKDPSLRPALRALVDDLDAPAALRAVALARLYALAPAEGEAGLMKALRGQGLAWPEAARAFEALPEGLQPAFDALLIERLSAASDLSTLEGVSALLARHASAAIAPQVAALHERGAGRWATRVEANLLGYLLRVDAPTASARLTALLADGQPRSGLLQALAAAAPYPAPALEAALITQLDAPDVARVIDAAHALRVQGSPASVAPLLARLTRWREAWGDQLPALEQQRVPHDDPRAQARRLEDALWTALTRARHWVLDPQTFAAVEAQCASAQARDQIVHARWFDASPLRVQVWLLDDDTARGTVGPFQEDSLTRLAARLTLLPPATAIVLVVDPDDGPRAAAARSTLEAAATAAGLKRVAP